MASTVALTVDYYTVAWISAIGKEYEFACELLEEEYDIPPDLRSDDSCYRFGTISGHKVIMAKLPEGIAGTSPATELATKIMASFPSLRFGLMVGIAGGAPTEKNDIRLGDVVVSVPVSSYKLSGVLNYHFGSSNQGRGFELRGSLNSPPGLLLNAVSKLKSHRGYARRVEDTIQDTIKKAEPDFEAYRRPPSNRDILYKASFTHTDRDVPCNMLCLNTEPYIVERVNREPGTLPVFHYGTIGSANDLMRDATIRDTLASDQGILCLEMESAGLMNTDFKCLVVRGISDYADTHKNDEWHGYAAAAAAAYAKHLLKCIRPVDVRQERSMCTGAQILVQLSGKVGRPLRYDTGVTIPQRHPNNDAKVWADEAALASQEDEYKALLKSLAFPNMHARLANIRSALPETCAWLFRHEHFKAWLDESKRVEHNGLLWIKGKPGSGKSTLMREALTRANQSNRNEVVVSYFFNARASDPLERSTLGLYRSLLHQLFSALGSPALSTIDPIFRSKIPIDDQDTKTELWKERELQNFLVDTLNADQSGPLTIFIDALDEGQEEEVRGMVAFFEEIGWRTRSAFAPLRLCLSSRPYPNISIDRCLHIAVEAQHEHRADIRLYVQKKLSGGHTSEMNELRSEVVQRSAGIFLWVELVVRMLNQAWDRGKRLHEMVEILTSVPRDLHDLFTDILGKNSQGFNECITLLRWMLFSRRALSPKELYLGVQQTYAPLNMDTVHTVDQKTLIRYILDCSRGLVEIKDRVRQAPVVQFIHESVRDYLLGTGILAHHQSSPQLRLGNTSSWRVPEKQKTQSTSQAGICHTEIAEGCLRYLLQITTHAPLAKNDLANHPLAQYAARYWWAHLRMSSRPRSRDLSDLASRLLTEGSNALLTWSRLCNLDTYLGNIDELNLKLSLADLASPLFYAAKIGMPEIVSNMINSGADPNAIGKLYGCSALQAASAEGHMEVVEILLNAGADADPWMRGDGNALYVATQYDQDEVVNLLLDRCADINANGGPWGTALHRAVQSNNLNMVQTLLSRGADPSTRGREGQTPLELAALYGHQSIVQTMLDRGANPDAGSSEYGSPLCAASSAGNETVVKMLLKRGADVNTQVGWLGSPLCAASYYGHKEVVGMLLSAGADVNARIECYPVKGLNDCIPLGAARAGGSRGSRAAAAEMESRRTE